MTLSILIVDDEAVARRRLRRLLRSQSDVAVVGECEDGVTAVDAIKSLAPDVVLLDIQMPEFDGFDVIQALGDDVPLIIFVTAHDEHALRAFEVHALDYLLKPVAADKVTRALARARAWRQASEGRTPDRRLLSLLQQFAAERRFLKRLPVRAGGRVIVLDLATVDWISAADNYVTLHVGPREWLVRGTMAWLVRELDPGRFARIHRGVIVQINRIAELIPEAHGDMTARLKDGTLLAVSRHFKAQLVSPFNL